MGDVDFRLLFESIPGLYLVLAPDLSIIAASDAYLETTMTRREEILGRSIFDAYPDGPDDAFASAAADLRASLRRVLERRAPDTMAVRRPDVRRPRPASGGFEDRYWRTTNTPVLGPAGEVRYVVHLGG